MNFHILTLFPEMVKQGIGTSITGRAIEQSLIHLNAIDIRDYTKNKHKKVDDYPYGGGAGMLMQAQPVYDAYLSIEPKLSEKKRVIYLTPQGKPFHQAMAEEFAREDDLVLLCGHYEGIDERVLEEIVTDYVSIGDFVLTGGELGAMVVVDAVSRLVPGVLNNEMSARTESFEGALLEYPQYTRPEVWMGKSVPDVLLSGNPKDVSKWRLEASIERTKERRPDLYEEYLRFEECLEFLLKDKLHYMDMIELIRRRRAQIIYFSDSEILLKDKESIIHFHAMLDETKEIMAFEQTKEIPLVCVHEEKVLDYLCEKWNCKPPKRCHNAVYTKKEKMPVKGLYRPDGKPMENGVYMKKLSLEHLPVVVEEYDHGSEEYIKDRIEAGVMFGAFIGEELVAFSGMHREGSIGMLQVLPKYRGMKLGTAMETYMMNWALDLGFTPYGQIYTDNDISMNLQKKLGLILEKGSIFWVEL